MKCIIEIKKFKTEEIGLFNDVSYMKIVHVVSKKIYSLVKELIPVPSYYKLLCCSYISDISSCVQNKYRENTRYTKVCCKFFV